MSKALRRFMAAAATVLAVVSCERRPLVSPSEAVKIAIKVYVKTVTNVNANVRSSIHLNGTNTNLWEDKLEQLDPDMMRVLIYDPSTDKLLSQSFISSNERDSEGNKVFKGNLGISHGDYNFLISILLPLRYPTRIMRWISSLTLRKSPLLRSPGS